MMTLDSFSILQCILNFEVITASYTSADVVTFISVDHICAGDSQMQSKVSCSSIRHTRRSKRMFFFIQFKSKSELQQLKYLILNENNLFRIRININIETKNNLFEPKLNL